MKTKILILLIFGLSSTINAQITIQNSVLSSGGFNFENASIISEFTFGETFTSTLDQGQNSYLTQGFHQPTRNKLTTPISVVGLYDLTECSFNVFPNPFRDEFTIEWENGMNINVEIYDLTGRLIYTERFLGFSTKIDLSTLAVGEYRLLILDGNGNRLNLPM